LEKIGANDFKAFEALGRRVGEDRQRWFAVPVAQAA